MAENSSTNDNIKDSCNLEIRECPEPQLEVTQDLELLAQEIAEAAVEDEVRRSSKTPSPTPVEETPVVDTETTERNETEEEEEEEEEGEEKSGGGKEDIDEGKSVHEEEEQEEEEEEDRQKTRSPSPVDEASWVLVDAEDETNEVNSEDNSGGNRRRSPEQRYTVFREFIAGQDLRQKLTDLGLICDTCGEPENDTDITNDDGIVDEDGTEVSLQALTVSCSESMVICDIPQDPLISAPDLGDPSTPHLKDPPRPSGRSGWRGLVEGARVEVELERRGALVVASVKVSHRDLLSALSSLQHLASSAGLVSYADVDVPSLLARAA